MQRMHSACQKSGDPLSVGVLLPANMSKREIVAGPHALSMSIANKNKASFIIYQIWQMHLCICAFVHLTEVGTVLVFSPKAVNKIDHSTSKTTAIKIFTAPASHWFSLTPNFLRTTSHNSQNP